MDTIKKVSGFTHSISFKILLVGFLSLMLLIPTAWIRNIIVERQIRSEEVSKEISSIWGREQILAGPILSIPYKKSYRSEKEEYIKTEIAHFLPEKLKVDATLNPSVRYRGIFRVVVYNAHIKVSGNFSTLDFSQLGINPEDVEFENSVLTVGIPDMRGIQNDVLLNWNDRSLQAIPGSLYRSLIPSGFHVRNINIENSLQKELSFNIDMTLNGSSSLKFYPLGKTTQVNVTSAWPDPSFEGAFLPASPSISESGFTASWLVTHLNRNFPQAWINDEYSFQDSSFGVGLFLAVNQYQKSERSSKYAIIVIALTFLLFLLIEILYGKRLHPIQYLLVGFAITLFYILLVSLSEQIVFARAFIISAFAVVLLITLYIHSSYRSRTITLITFLVLLLLYVFIYIILQMQDYSLLFGSIGLFIALSTFMYLTRKINWYREEYPSEE